MAVRHSASGLIVLALLAATAPGQAESAVTQAPGRPAPAPPTPAAGSSAQALLGDASAALQIPFEKYRLKNGLTVILHQDRSLPVVSSNLWYHVGPANEPKGRSGFAHLFEHLMFEGSRHVGREFDRLLESAGATNVNGTTSWDRTNYFETAPRERLELLLWLESDRMGFMLDGLTQERLDVQRDVVKNERRQSYENAPYGPSALTLLDTLFPAGTAYHGAIIGSMADLSAATLDDVRDFFRTYYTPSNATLTLAGDFEFEPTKRLIARYFETLPDRPLRVVTRAPIAPPSPQRLSVKEAVELPRIAFGYVTPPAYTADDPALEVTMAVLAGGKATRLYRALVVEEKIASDVDAALDSNQLASSVVVSATVTSGKPVAKAEQLLAAVLEGLGRQGPTAQELDRAKRRILLNVLSNLELLNGPGGESGRAGILQRFDHYKSDPGYLPNWVAAIAQVSAADVQRVVGAYLGPNHRVVVITEPTKGSEGGAP